MADQIQLRGGTTAQHSSFTGALREVTVDTDKKTVVVHDGATAGGVPLLRQDLNNAPNGGVVLTKLDSTGAVGKVLTAQGVGNPPAWGDVPVVRLFSNRIINGRMQIDQRNAGAAQTITAGAALAYSIDRWYAYCTGANVTGQRIALANSQNRYRFTGAASVTGVGFGQRIEAANSLDLAGQTTTLQVALASSSLTTINWNAYYANTADSFGTLASPTRTSIASGSFTITSTEAMYSAQISIPSAATTGIEIVFSGGALLASQTLQIGQVQLELGGNATSVEVLSVGLELSRCQRYYEKSYDAAVVPGTSTTIGICVSNAPSLVNTYRYAKVAHRVEKRAAPTVVVYSQTGSTGQASNGAGTDLLANSAQVTDASPSGFSLVNNRGSDATPVGSVVMWHYTSSAEL